MIFVYKKLKTIPKEYPWYLRWFIFPFLKTHCSIDNNMEDKQYTMLYSKVFRGVIYVIGQTICHYSDIVEDRHCPEDKIFFINKESLKCD